MRVVALLLSFVLLWSGLTTVEPPRLGAPAAAPTAALRDASTLLAPSDGSVEHHHLDDLPSQALGDPPVEIPALLASSPAPGGRVPKAVRPPPVASRTVPAPWLAGLLRPPCVVPVRG